MLAYQWFMCTGAPTHCSNNSHWRLRLGKPPARPCLVILYLETSLLLSGALQPLLLESLLFLIHFQSNLLLLIVTTPMVRDEHLGVREDLFTLQVEVDVRFQLPFISQRLFHLFLGNVSFQVLLQINSGTVFPLKSHSFEQPHPTCFLPKPSYHARSLHSPFQILMKLGTMQVHPIVSLYYFHSFKHSISELMQVYLALQLSIALELDIMLSDRHGLHT